MTYTTPVGAEADAAILEVDQALARKASVQDGPCRRKDCRWQVDGPHSGCVLTVGCNFSPVAAVPARANDTQVAGKHYKKMGVEPWDVVDTWPLEQRIGAYRHGALKYLMRMGSKDENAQEIAKGKHYMEKLLEVLKENGNG